MQRSPWSTSRAYIQKMTAVFAAAVSCVGQPSQAQEDCLRNAKDMFYEELKTQAHQTNGIAFCLELHRPGSPTTLCNNRYPFKSGDGVRLHIKSSSPGYAYIYLDSGSTGKKCVLYPPAGSSEDNRLEAGKQYVIPPNGLLKMDNNPCHRRHKSA